MYVMRIPQYFSGCGDVNKDRWATVLSPAGRPRSTNHDELLIHSQRVQINAVLSKSCTVRAAPVTMVTKRFIFQGFFVFPGHSCRSINSKVTCRLLQEHTGRSGPTYGHIHKCTETDSLSLTHTEQIKQVRLFLTTPFQHSGPDPIGRTIPPLIWLRYTAICHTILNYKPPRRNKRAVTPPLMSSHGHVISF